MTTRQMRAPSIFDKIWGNFPISPKIGGRGDESDHGILKLHHKPTVRNILTNRPFAGSEI